MKNTWSVNCDSLSEFPYPSSPVGIYHPLAHEGAARPVSQLGQRPSLRNHKPEKQEKEGLSLKLTLWRAEYKFSELKRPGASPAKPGWRGMSQVTDRTTGLQLCRDVTRSQECKSGSGGRAWCPWTQGPVLGESTLSASSAGPLKLFFFPGFLA